MPVKAHPSSKAAGGQPSARRASRSVGARRRGGGMRRRSLARQDDLRTDEFEVSSDSSEDYMRLGRIGPANSRSRTANSDSCSSQSSDQDKSNLSNASSGSEGVFQQCERAAIRQQQQPLVPLPSSAIAHPKDTRSMRLCSHHRREMMPAARNCDEGSEFGGQRDGDDEGNFRVCASRTVEGGGGRVGGKVTLRSCSPTNPNSSFTRSGEPSSQIAYQAALSPLTSDSNDQSPPAKRRDNRNNRNSQSVRPAVRDANTSNRQESTKRHMMARRFLSSPSLSPSPQTRHRQCARRESRWESLGESRGESRWESRIRESRDGDRYSKLAEAPLDENYSNLDEIYDSSRRRDCRRQSPQSCQRKSLVLDQRIRSASQSKQHQKIPQRLQMQSRQRKTGDNIYVGNHVESDILEGRKLNSLRRLYSMRNQRYENDDYRRARKSEPERQVRNARSWEESDREQQSPRQRHLRKQQQLQLQHQHQQHQQHQQQQQQQQCIQQLNNKARNCRIRQSGVYHDDDYRENIYWDNEHRTARGGTSSSRRQSWRPRRTCQLSPAWSNGLDDACSVEAAMPPRSGDARRNCEQGRAGRQWGGHNNQLAERRRSECMSSRLEDRGKRDRYEVFDKYDMPDRYDRTDRMNHGSREDDTRRPQTWSLRQTEFEDDAGDKIQNGRRIKPDERRHWCDGTGRMRETRCRRETIFSCPYVSLALQTKTYECDRCAGYSSYTNNLNSNPSRLRLRLDDTASQDSWATPEFDRSRNRRSRTRGEKEEEVGHRYRHPTSGRFRNGAATLNE